MYKQICLIVAVLVSMLLTGCGSQTQPSQPVEKEKPPLKIGYNKWAGYGSLFIAQEKGFFEQEGVKVEVVNYESYEASFSDLANKRLDGSAGTIADVVIQSASGLPVQAIWVLDISDGGDVVVGNGDLAGPEDLKGKRIGVSIGTFSQVFAVAGLANYGLTPEDVTMIDVKEDHVAEEIAAGSIDAGHTWEPYLSEVINAGGKILFTSADTPGVIADVLTIRGDIIQDRPEDIQALVRGLTKATEFWQENPEEGNKIVGQAVDIPEAEMADVMSGIKLYSLDDNLRVFDPQATDSLHGTVNLTGEFFAEHDILKNEPVAAEQLLNGSFLERK
jgi:NitT/TauT family transport system substrate-binding protein